MFDIGQPKDQLDTPALWVDIERLEENIAKLAAHFQTAGVQWRPHFKGIKIPSIAHKLIKAGAIGITCAKLSEAEVLALAGIGDILIANQIVGPHKTMRLAHLQHSADVKVAVDHPQNVAELGRAAVDHGVEIGVLVDVNTGMERTGTTPGEEAVALSSLVHQTAGLRYLGLMAWEGHTLVNEDPAVKEQEIYKAVNLLLDTAAQCRSAGLPVTIVSGGGSGTYKITPFIPGMTEIQAGGAIFSDVAYQSWGVETTPCLYIRTRVTSRPASDRIIIDAGFKAMPVWHATPKALGIEHIKKHATSAEHGILTLDQPNHDIGIGEAFDFIVGYTDSTLFLHDTLYGIRRGKIEVVWEISGRGKLR